MAWRVLGVGAPFQDAVPDESLEPFAEHLARDPEVAAQIVEAARDRDLLHHADISCRYALAGGGSVVGAAGTEPAGMTWQRMAAGWPMTCTIWNSTVSRGTVWHWPDRHQGRS